MVTYSGEESVGEEEVSDMHYWSRTSSSIFLSTETKRCGMFHFNTNLGTFQNMGMEELALIVLMLKVWDI